MAVTTQSGSSSCTRVPDLPLDYKSAQFRKKISFCTRLKVCCEGLGKASVNGSGRGLRKNVYVWKALAARVVVPRYSGLELFLRDRAGSQSEMRWPPYWNAKLTRLHSCE
jgi:hypothetical protein